MEAEDVDAFIDGGDIFRIFHMSSDEHNKPFVIAEDDEDVDDPLEAAIPSRIRIT